MTKEQEQAIESMQNFVNSTMDTTVVTAKEMKIVLNLIQQLQEENKQKDKKVNKILNRLDNDIKNITETKAKKRTDCGYLDDYTKCRLKAYRTKTREIKEYIEDIYFEKKVNKWDG